MCEEVEEGVWGGEILAVPGGHQHHQPIHHVQLKNSWVFRYIFGCGRAKDRCGVAKHECGVCGVAKDGCGVDKNGGGAAKYECVWRSN